MWRSALVVCLVVGCGTRALETQPDAATDAGVTIDGGALEGQPLPLARELIVVAHQDDDELFMQPDLYETVATHVPLNVVYVTAGDANNGVAYADSRVVDAKAAYALVAGASDWSCGWIAISGHAAQHCRLADANVSLVFLGYPDGGLSGDLPNSLLNLWQGTITGADTVADQVAHYDQPGLIATIAEIISTTRPRLVRTLDVAGTHGSDHADHVLVGALTVLGLAAAGSDANVLLYRGYDINDEPANVLEPVYDVASLGMRSYEACAEGCGGTCNQTACPTIDDTRYLGFLHRRYAIGIRRPPLTGVLRHHGMCVVAGPSGVTLGDCANATPLTFDRGGAIRANKQCLHVNADHSLELGVCHADAERNFLFDDEGHLWTGTVPDPGVATIGTHAMCVVAQGPSHTLAAANCGVDLDWMWELVRPTIATTRATLGLTQTGRAVRLGDLDSDGKADLCAVEATGLLCAAGDGAGHFAPAIRVDSATSPLAIEPASLVLGDVDGDGRVDACGRDADGILCATAASGFAAVRWSTDFARTGAASPADRSLAIVDRSVCGILATGVGCSTSATIFSTWPATATDVWPGDLDGDGVPDWCAATPQGLACSRTSDHALTTDGVPWSYSIGGVVDGSTDAVPADTTTGGLADISGDGRADACVADGRSVRCAISQGHGFGPRTTILELAKTSTIAGLWLGDLDGDGKADACVDDGTSIICAPSP